MLELNNVHEDTRGSIKCLTGEELLPYPEVTVFTTKKGYARGGCVHPNSREHICVIAGEINFFYTDPDLCVHLSAGGSYTVEPNTPHYFVALEDSVVMEWGPQMEEKNQRCEKFRAIVEEINRR